MSALQALWKELLTTSTRAERDAYFACTATATVLCDILKNVKYHSTLCKKCEKFIADKDGPYGGTGMGKVKCTKT
jgi:hypothetical protein